MLRSMRTAVAVVLLAIAGAWGAAVWHTPVREHRAARPLPPPPQTAPEPPEAVAVPRRPDPREVGTQPLEFTPQPAERRPAPGVTAERPRPTPRILRGITHKAIGAAQRVERVYGPPEGQQLPSSEQLGVGIQSPAYAEAQTAYAYEPRDGAWATPKEQRMRKLLIDAGLGPSALVVSCRETVCRVVLQVEDADSGLEPLLAVPGLAKELNIDADTAYSLRAGQLSVYGRRRDDEGRDQAPGE